MKTIIQAIKNGDAKERLAIAADIATLAGVSLATVGAGILTVSARATNMNAEAIVGVTIFTLIALVFFCLVIIIFIWIYSEYSKNQLSHPIINFLLKFILWILFTIALLYSVALYYSFIESMIF